MKNNYGFRFIEDDLKQLTSEEMKFFLLFLRMAKNQNIYHNFMMLLRYDNHWNDIEFMSLHTPLEQLRKAITYGSFTNSLIWYRDESQGCKKYLTVEVRYKLREIETEYINIKLKAK